MSTEHQHFADILREPTALDNITHGRTLRNHFREFFGSIPVSIKKVETLTNGEKQNTQPHHLVISTDISDKEVFSKILNEWITKLMMNPDTKETPADQSVFGVTSMDIKFDGKVYNGLMPVFNAPTHVGEKTAEFQFVFAEELTPN